MNKNLKFIFYKKENLFINKNYLLNYNINIFYFHNIN
jgi:hypothetical protein